MASHEIKELSQKRDSLNSQLANANDNLNQLETRLETDTQQLELLNRQYAVKLSQIRSTEDEIFQLKNKLNILKETAAMLFPEIEQQKQTFATLSYTKKQLQNTILSIKDHIKKTKEQNRQLRQSVAKEDAHRQSLLDDKQKLSDDISSQLAKTNLDQEKIETQLIEINEHYILCLNENNTQQSQLSALTTEMDGHQQAIKAYKKKLTELTRVKVLTKELDSLETAIDQYQKDNDLYADRLSGLKKSLANKKISLERISAENNHRQDQIQSLESSVGAYDKALTDFKKIDSLHKEVSTQMENDIQVVKEILAKQNEYAYALQLAEEKATMVIEGCLKMAS